MFENMSFKSQKSWNEEIAEIWEKSYSVRSASEESLSCEDESQSEALSRILLSAMNPAVLSKLRRHFSKRHIRSLRDVTRRVEEIMRAAAAEEGIEFQPPEPASEPPRAGALWIDQHRFVNAINTIFGNHKYEVHAYHLFQALDPLCTRQASWGALLDRLAAAGERRTRLTDGPKINEEDIVVLPFRHANRETIVKVVNIVTDSSYCMVAVSRGGRVGVYHERKLLHQYQLWYHRSGITNRVKNCWVTDAIYMRDVQCLVISASDRSLTFYDASILTHAPVFCVTGIPNIPTCLDYDPSQHKTEPSELAFGDERGNIVRMIFLQPRVTLLYKNYADRINSYFWGELSSPPHDAYLSLISWSRVHSRSVRRLQYLRSKDAIMSCSHDSTNTVVLRHRRGKIKDYVFNVPRGVHSFTAIHNLQLLATGSADGSRLWELTQSEPFATFKSIHAVQDIAVVAHLEMFVVLYKNCSLEIWDLYEECLLQSIKIKFPFLGVLGKKVEFGSYCIYAGPPNIAEMEDKPSSECLASSRRSSVHRAETGGLVVHDLQHDTVHEEETSYHPSHQLIVSCCDHMAILPLSAPVGSIPLAPRDARAPSLPSEWTQAETLISSLATESPDPPPKIRSDASEGLLSVEAARRPAVASKAVAEECSADLEDMLEKAGLQGILEKDFVLLTGLKRDLNQKIADLKTNMKEMSLPVSLGAPYLALRLHEPEPPVPPAPDAMAERYNQLMSLFPAPEDNSSTPRRRSKSSSSK